MPPGKPNEKDARAAKKREKGWRVQEESGRRGERARGERSGEWLRRPSTPKPTKEKREKGQKERRREQKEKTEAEKEGEKEQEWEAPH